MRKQLLCLVVLVVLVLPLSSFKAASKIPVVHKHQVKVTDWVVGYFDQNGHTYQVTGDNFGGSSGNVTGLIEDGTSVCLSVSGTWTNMGDNHVKYKRPTGGSFVMFNGIFYAI